MQNIANVPYGPSKQIALLAKDVKKKGLPSFLQPLPELRKGELRKLNLVSQVFATAFACFNFHS
jgi:hypothetical protein